MPDLNNKVTLVIGGARSGKSSFAQELAISHGGKVLFCATAEALDDEMKDRIETHRKSRPQDWDTLEAPRNIGMALQKTASNYEVVIIDCITLLVANCLGDNDNAIQTGQTVNDEIDRLIECISGKQCNYILVTNEVGSGLVPENSLARIYRDALGRANQKLAKCADEVYLMTAGLPLKLK